MGEYSIPAGAIKATFHYNHNVVEYYVWEIKGGKYQWTAQGNSGEAISLSEALKQAREWIMFDKMNKENS